MKSHKQTMIRNDYKHKTRATQHETLGAGGATTQKTFGRESKG